MSTKLKLPKQLKTSLGVAAALAMGLGMSSNAYAQRDRPTIDTSLGYNVILSDQKTALRGVSLSFDGGDPYSSITPIMPTQASFDKLATEYGYNFVHVYLEGDAGQNPDPAGINLALADELVAKTKAADLYLMITIGNNGENGAIHSMQKTLDFWSLYGARYKDETHVIYEAHNEPVAGQNHAWSDTDWDRQVNMYNHIRSLAPSMMIFLGSFMSFNGASSAMYGADYIKTGVGDANIWDNAAFAWHGYWDLPGIESTINPIEDAGTTYPGLLCTEFWPGDTENGYNAAFETHHMGWAQFQWLNAQDMDLDNLKNKLDNAGTVWKPELAGTNWPTAGAPNVPASGTKIGIYSHFLGGFVNHDNTNMTATATSYTADGNANDGFTVVDAGDGFVALQTASGNYVSATGDGNPLTVTASAIGVNEKWEWMQLCPDQTNSAMT